MSKRALRRHHRARIHRRCRRILGYWWSIRDVVDRDWLDRVVLHRAQNFTVCSCWMCGNSRRMRGCNGPVLTLKERCNLLDLAEENLVDFPVPRKWKDQLPGGLADKRKPEDFDPDQLAKGIAVELEHTDNIDTATEIAMDHLAEDERYYDKLAKMERGLKNKLLR